MKKITLSLLFLASALTSVRAQEFKCGTPEHEQKMRARYPQIAQTEAELELETRNFSEERSAPPVYVIPVVFHIIHQNGAENIPDANIYDQMRILNEDFRKMNADTSDIVQQFKSRAADAEIEFRLAQKDPNGNCTNGIDRIYSALTNNADDDSKLNPWPRNKYLNIWVVKSIGSGAAGYAYLPSTANWDASIDGIIILYNYIGSLPPGNVNQSRALTHEIGHWINLNHVWGNTNNPGVSCGDDNVTDTPITKGWTSCNLNGANCSSGVLENVQNFMEYSYCSNMFTSGQKTRMRAALASSTAQRSSLWTSTNLTATGTNGTNTLCVAEFKASRNAACVNAQITFTDQSYNVPTSWSWSFPGGTPSTSTAQNPVVTYSNPGIYDVTLSVTNSSGTITKTKTGFVSISSTAGSTALPFAEGFETTTSIPNNDWSVLNNGGNTWTVSSSAGSTGSKSVMIQNTTTSVGNVDELYAPSISVPSSMKVYFKVAYAQRTSTTNDKLQVYTSSNCGASWIPRYTKMGSALSTRTATTTNFVPSATQWRQDSAVLPIGNVFLKFVFTSEGGNNVYIDDINIAGPTSLKETEQVTGFTVFPNPSSTGTVRAVIDLSESATNELFVFDVLGKQVQHIKSEKKPAGENIYDLHLSSGVYFVKAIAGTSSFTEKVVVY